MKTRKQDTGCSLDRRSFVAGSAGAVICSGMAAVTGATAAGAGEPTPGFEYRVLGRTGLRVTAVGFGTVHHDRPNVVHRVVERGVTFFDTGRMYANGRNEEMMGRVLEPVRDSVVLQTKFSSRYHDDPAAIEKSIEDSLRALRTDHIDILLMHSVSSERELLSTAARDTLQRAVEQGKVRFTGYSSHASDGWKLLEAAAGAGWFDVALVPYNHAGYFDHTVYRGFHVDWNQPRLEQAMEKAVKAGMGIAAMKTCSAGPCPPEGGGRPSHAEGLRRILRNPHISTMAVCMGSFREVDHDLAAME